MKLKTNKHYHIITERQVSLGEYRKTLFINKKTMLLSKYVESIRLFDGSHFMTIIKVIYDQNNMPVNMMQGDKQFFSQEYLNGYVEPPKPFDKKVLVQHMAWDNNIVTQYEDNNGNWYDKNVISGECPFQPDLELLGRALELVNESALTALRNYNKYTDGNKDRVYVMINHLLNRCIYHHTVMESRIAGGEQSQYYKHKKANEH